MISFTKMHGLGNDFVMMNGFGRSGKTDFPELAKTMCDRRFGVGSDGLIVAEPGDAVEFKMRMWNPDGSESEMCGNGIRCFAQFVIDEGLTISREIQVETGAGILQLELRDYGQVRVDMGQARFTRGEIGMAGDPSDFFENQQIEVAGTKQSASAVSMGNPHLVVFTNEASEIPLESWGPELEHHPLFPQRVNVHFVEIIDRNHIRQFTWERGAGRTLACGTGACASAVAAFRLGKSEARTKVSLPGGDLDIEIANDFRVWMTGPCERVFTGTWTETRHAVASLSTKN